MKAESEARFTAPSHTCPYPDYWTSTDDHSTEIEVSEMLAGLVRGLQPNTCIETGTAWGQTAEAIGKALRQNGHGALYTYETDEHRAGESHKRIKGLPVNVVLGSSLETGYNLWPFGVGVPMSKPVAVDFAFFDSEFPLRIEEFRHFRPHMTNRTVVAFHDTAFQAGSGQFPNGDLRDNIQWELVDAGIISIIDLPTPRGITIGRVL